MRAEFEEKSFEQHLTSELVHSRRLFFPPGQVLEDIVGFDVALRTSNREFWRLFPHMYPWWRRMLFMHPPGVQLNREWWQELEREVSYFPPFKFNCFIQAKRPERMGRSDAAEYSLWGSPYFRFDTFQSQQQALASLAARTAGSALVVYACPAFHTYSELWGAVQAAQLVQRSNFCEVAKLNGHTRYSFAAPGNIGIAHSEPVPVESVPFEELLASLEDQRPAQSNSAFLTSTGEVLNAAAEHLAGLRGTYTAMAESLFKGAESKLATALGRIYAFQFVCNVQLLIGHDGSPI